MEIAKKSTVRDENGLAIGVDFAFANGSNVKVLAHHFSTAMQAELMQMGIRQKFGDAYAQAESIGAAVAAFERVVAQVKSGVWNAGRTGTGGIWVEAIARATGASLDDCMAKWSKMSKKEQDAAKKKPQIRAAHAAIQAERAQAELDALEAESGTTDVEEEFDLSKI